MRFVVVARDRGTGGVGLVFASAFAERDDAIAALSSLEDLAAYRDRDLFVVDLDTSTPVLLVPGDVGETVVGQRLTAEDIEAAFAQWQASAVAEPEAQNAPGWPFIHESDLGAGPTLVGEDLAVADTERSEVWWLETDAEGPVDVAAVPDAVVGDVERDADEARPAEGPADEVPAADPARDEARLVDRSAEEPIAADMVPEEPIAAQAVPEEPADRAFVADDADRTAELFEATGYMGAEALDAGAHEEDAATESLWSEAAPAEEAIAEERGSEEPAADVRADALPGEAVAETVQPEEAPVDIRGDALPEEPLADTDTEPTFEDEAYVAYVGWVEEDMITLDVDEVDEGAGVTEISLMTEEFVLAPEVASDVSLADEPTDTPEETPTAQVNITDPVVLRVSLESWTCSDCIFEATCVRAGLDRPAECLSFQWRPR